TTTPAVTGTPDGNDFPNGKTTRYTYSSGFTDERLNHNLTSIIAPNQVADGTLTPRLQFTYDTHDRALMQQVGGTNTSRGPAGGTITYQYQVLGTAPPGDFATPVIQTMVTDRNGNITEYRYNQLGDIVRERDFTNRDIRPSDPTFY